MHSRIITENIKINYAQSLAKQKVRVKKGFSDDN